MERNELLAALAALLAHESTSEQAAPAKGRKPATTRKPATRAAKAKASEGVITCEQAWIALGSDATFKPSKPNDPARNPQLWRLNTLGLLRVGS